jgi:hypothetical protein
MFIYPAKVHLIGIDFNAPTLNHTGIFTNFYFHTNTHPHLHPYSQPNDNQDIYANKYTYYDLNCFPFPYAICHSNANPFSR